MSNKTERQAMIALAANPNPATPITIPTVVTTDFNATNLQYAEAIVVPQELTAGTVFIRVEAGGQYELRLQNPRRRCLGAAKRQAVHL